MNSKILGLLAIVALVGGVGYFVVSKNSAPAVIQKSETPVVKSISRPSDIGASNQDASPLSFQYIEYSAENLVKATNNGGKAVIFFHATWCPTCKAADADLEANYKKLPNNVTILKADYDTSSELKTKYAVTMQDTWVSVDAQGTMVKKWNSGGQAVDSLIANL